MTETCDIETDLSPLEQRRERLRDFADRVLEAIEALPMPETPLEGERTLRAVTAADRMLIQVYTLVGSDKTIQPASRRVTLGNWTPPPSRSAPAAPLAPPVQTEAPEQPEAVPFVYHFDDDEVDDEVVAEAPEPLSATAESYAELEAQANAIFNAYLESRKDLPPDDW